LSSDLLSADPVKAIAAIKKDSAVIIYLDMVNTYNQQITPKLNELQARINKLQRTYMKAQMEVVRDKTFYPDANSTLRVTYGKVKGYEARDA